MANTALGGWALVMTLLRCWETFSENVFYRKSDVRGGQCA